MKTKPKLACEPERRREGYGDAALAPTRSAIVVVQVRADVNAETLAQKLLTASEFVSASSA